MILSLSLANEGLPSTRTAEESRDGNGMRLSKKSWIQLGCNVHMTNRTRTEFGRLLRLRLFEHDGFTPNGFYGEK